MTTQKFEHIEIEILLKDLDHRREEIMHFTKLFNDNSKLIKTYFILFGILLTAILLQKPFDFANKIISETNLDLNTYSIIILIAATIFLYFLISERLSLLCQIYLNGSRIKQIEKIINNHYKKDLLIWESEIIDNYYFFKFSKKKLWINPTYLLGFSYSLIIFFITTTLIILSFRVLDKNYFLVYASITVILTIFFSIQLIEIHRTGKVFFDSLFEKAEIKMTVNRETISYFNIMTALNKKYAIPILTFLFGFFLFFLSSLITNSFFLDSPYNYPLLIFPTILIGDSILLPIFNYRFFSMLRNKNFEKISKLKTLIILILSILLSSFINLYVHFSWISDNYTGFMDIELGKLSFAGYSHLIFSILQTAIIFYFISLSIFFVKKKAINHKLTFNTWLIFVFFSLLSILDFLVQKWHLNIPITDFSFFDYISRFSTIIFSLIILTIIWLRTKTTLHNNV